eukprot:6041760-Karenia_brevis.AAC.1
MATHWPAQRARQGSKCVPHVSVLLWDFSHAGSAHLILSYDASSLKSGVPGDPHPRWLYTPHLQIQSQV